MVRGLGLTALADLSRFGIVYMILELLPPLSMLFLFTTAAGSALWAVKLEEEEEEEQNSQRRIAEADVEEDEQPPAYEDNPV
jgi:hypothetical protein